MSRNLRVLLVNPPYLSQIRTTTKDVHKAMERKPPLGILSIGTYLKKYTDFEIKLLDNQLDGFAEQEISELIKAFQPDVVGITVVSFKLYPAYLLTQVIKKACASTHICWGGPHLSIYPKESLELPGVDSIILGDGEVPFAQLCQKLYEGQTVSEIEGVYTKTDQPNDGNFYEYFHLDLNELPFPELTLLPHRRYTAFLTNNLLATAITSRGCPYRCIFCRLELGKIRMLSLEKVVQQIQSYLELGVREIEFYDETFNLSTKRVMDFANHVIDKGLNFKWSFRGRVNAVTEEMLQLVKEAGCQRIQYGVEAGSDRVLKILKKGTTVDMIRNCFLLTNKAKIDTVAYFIIGNPGETIEEMRQTVKLAREIKPSYLEYAIFNISPGTESYRMALEQGIIQRDHWREYASFPTENMPVLVWTKDQTYEELKEIRRTALKDFYMRPDYFFSSLRNLRSGEARQVLKTGFHLLKDIAFKKA